MNRSRLLALSVLLILTGPALAALTASDVTTDGMSLTIVPAGKTFEIEPLEVRTYSAKGKLKVIKPTWRGGFYLPVTSWRFGTLRRGSLVITRAINPT